MDGRTSRNWWLTAGVLCVVYLALQLPLLTTVTLVIIDEPWYADVAHNVSVGNGFVNTTNGAGGGDKMFLFTAVSSLFYRVLGGSLWTARFVSVMGGLLALAGLLAILRRERIGPAATALTGLALAFCNVFYVVFRTVRPEGWTAALGMWSLYFALGMVRDRSWRSTAAAGAVSGLAFLCHPNAALYVGIFGLTALVLSIRERQLRTVGSFIAGGIPVLLLLVAFVIWARGESLGTFFGKMVYRTQLSENVYAPTLSETVAEFFRNYTLGIKRLAILLFEAGLLVAGIVLGRLRPRLRLVAVWGLAFFVLGLVALKPFATRHFAEVLVFVMVLLGMGLQLAFDRIRDRGLGGRRLALVFVALTGFYLLHNLGGEGYLWMRQAKQTAYSDVERWLDDRVPDEATVLSLYHFYFPLRHNRLYTGYTRWEYFDRYESQDALIASGDLDYIVISDFRARDLNTTSGRKIEGWGQERQRRIYEKIHDAAVAGGTLVDSLPTVGYGTIEIYAMKTEGKTP